MDITSTGPSTYGIITSQEDVDLSSLVPGAKIRLTTQYFSFFRTGPSYTIDFVYEAK